MLVLLLRLPESPRWLVKQDRGGDDARDVLDRVRPSNYDVAGELDEMGELAHEEKTAKTRGWSGLRAGWVRPALILGCGIAIFTQLSGIEMIIYYSPTILTDNGFSESVALEVSVALGGGLPGGPTRRVVDHRQGRPAPPHPHHDSRRGAEPLRLGLAVRLRQQRA